jgi:hypothetical protein
MRFASELELQRNLAQALRERGFDVIREVSASNGRADIITNFHLIECKLVLTRESLLQALGQLRIYAMDWPKHKQVICGCSAANDEKYRAAYRDCVRLGVEIWRF